eukprot:6132096-Amphidinium_carterae.1
MDWHFLMNKSLCLRILLLARHDGLNCPNLEDTTSVFKMATLLVPSRAKVEQNEHYQQACALPTQPTLPGLTPTTLHPGQPPQQTNSEGRTQRPPLLSQSNLAMKGRAGREQAAASAT